jgi:hypothetical protein
VFERLFGGYSVGIERFGKKIGCREISQVFVKIEKSKIPIFLPSLRIKME